MQGFRFVPFKWREVVFISISVLACKFLLVSSYPLCAPPLFLLFLLLLLHPFFIQLLQYVPALHHMLLDSKVAKLGPRTWTTRAAESNTLGCIALGNNKWLRTMKKPNTIFKKKIYIYIQLKTTFFKL